MRVLQRKLQFELPVEVRDAGAWKPLVVELNPQYIELRQKGRRCSYRIDWESVYFLAVRASLHRQEEQDQ